MPSEPPAPRPPSISAESSGAGPRIPAQSSGSSARISAESSGSSARISAESSGSGARGAAAPSSAPSPPTGRRRFAVGALTALPLAWAGLAVLLGGGSGAPGPGRIALAALLLALAVLALARLRPLAALAVHAGLVLAVGAGFARLEPALERDWVLEQSRLPRVELAGERVTIRDRRAFRWGADAADAAEGTDGASGTDGTGAAGEPGWVTATYDLAELEGVDLVVVHFGERTDVGHTMVSFRFADGRHLVASVEVRKERGERYGMLRGLFRQFELVYVLGDERDLIGLRTLAQNERVYLYPTDAGPDAARRYLVDVLARAERLAAVPEFYDTLTNNCTTNLVRHWEVVNGRRLGFDLRALLPGRVDELAAETGLVKGAATLAAQRERALVTERARAAAGRDDFSARLR